MKHLKDYFRNFEPDELSALFAELYQDGWRVSEENFVDAFETSWNFRDIDHFVCISRQAFAVIVASYKMFLELKDIVGITNDTKNSQEKLESANSKIKLLEEQNGNLKKELDAKRKELHDLKTSVKSQKPSKAEVPVESPRASTKEYIALRRRKYVKIE